MKDFRITAGEGKAGESQPEAALIHILINGSEDIRRRFELVASNLPYRAADADLLLDEIEELVKALAAATWKRIGDAVPGYGFAEELGRRYRESGRSMAALMLQWQILRRAIHLVLADNNIRTGEGDRVLLRQIALMNYAIDWATEASVVGYVMSDASGG